MAARAGVPRGQVWLATIWGLIAPLLGLAQVGLLPGPNHWIIQVIHLLVGLGAIAQAEGLAVGITHREMGAPFHTRAEASIRES